MSDQTTPTSKLAGQVAALHIGGRRARILELLRERPSALFELAATMNVGDHQISGVLTALHKDGFIERSGERRVKPETKCEADVWRICRVTTDAPPANPFGLPTTWIIDNEPYDLQEQLASEGYPGMPYARRADTGGQRLLVRVDVVECPACGRTLMQNQATDPALKLLTCGRADCSTVWRPVLAREPGKAPSLILVKRD